MKTYSIKNFVCNSCKYYISHYIRSNTRYYPIKGHCTHETIRKKRSKSFELRESCEYWETDEDKKEEIKKSIEETLQSMEKHLADIADMLKQDLD